jgi:hypothetical protein
MEPEHRGLTFDGSWANPLDPGASPLAEKKGTEECSW